MGVGILVMRISHEEKDLVGSGGCVLIVVKGVFSYQQAMACE
jgi:hypothetical protein